MFLLSWVELTALCLLTTVLFAVCHPGQHGGPRL